ncbi:hypothetical protein S40285_08086 [Stachybotrys chlorohalonatus IBT 40285]|uniref:U1-type domain-containing protein n=1 Tax=Stachybotrys chlorohalonatus (strain IBT 40285) TaxID=1283841 RepID=A0A084Q930_STAC4|nr:hypothetical protein S40285_08086 [Stachybotrys chlorohalonata IBT 40285]
MSEHWKSTPKYWCKHCACYVRDTKLERQNHEATGKHQSALKRFLRDLHRGHEREEREKDRAKQEIARLNGVVGSSSSTSSSAAAGTSRGAASTSSKPAVATEAQLKKQREQLAELGIAVPTTIRPEMAIAGEWTVTNTRVIDGGDDAQPKEEKLEARATGVRKRELPEEKKEEEEVLQGLFKKPRRWGRDSKMMPQEGDAELDALLSGSLAPMKRTTSPKVEDTEVKAEKPEVKDEQDVVKEEPDDASPKLTTVGDHSAGADVAVKTEDSEPHVSSVVFKKRKPKGIRQK